MKKVKMNLEKLKVTSFTTSLDLKEDNTNKVLGGSLQVSCGDCVSENGWTCLPEVTAGHGCGSFGGGSGPQGSGYDLTKANPM